MTRLFAAACAAVFAAQLFASPAVATGLKVMDAYARSSNPKVGAVFMRIMNPSGDADRLVEVRSSAARRVELHTHEFEDGIARMREVDAIEVPADGMAALVRGGDHVMLLGLTEPLEQGGTVPLTLVFESGAEITLDAP
ncbi:MAG: copper chaperone PCu(A)C, partial [Pseudomonadota bacterium]